MIFLTSELFNVDKCDLTFIFKNSAAERISFDFLFNFLANSNTFIFCAVIGKLTNYILVFQVSYEKIFNYSNHSPYSMWRISREHIRYVISRTIYI